MIGWTIVGAVALYGVVTVAQDEMHKLSFSNKRIFRKIK